MDKKACSVLRLVLWSVTPCLSGMSIGFAQGYSAVAIPKLKEDRGRLDVDDVSWIGSLLSVGLMAGTFLGGLLAERLDRRWCVLATSPVVILGWISIGLADVTDLTWILVGRFLTGLGTGMQIPLNSMYLGELSNSRNRGVLTSLSPLFTCIGILVSYAVGIALSWRLAALVGAVLTATAMASVPSMNVSNASKTDLVEGPEDALAGGWAAVVRPMALLSALFFIQCFSGAHAVSYYTSTVFKSIGLTASSEDIGVLFVGASFVVGYCLATAWFVPRLGRKTLLLVSSLCMAAAMATLAALDAFKSSQDSVAVALMIIFVIAYSCGLGPVPYMFLGELFPHRSKGLATGITSAMHSIFAFSAVKCFPHILEWLSVGSTLLVCSGVCVSGMVFVAALVPETKDLTPQEINDLFESQKQLPFCKSCQTDS